jgi:hypothetical protein
MGWRAAGAGRSSNGRGHIEPGGAAGPVPEHRVGRGTVHEYWSIFGCLRSPPNPANGTAPQAGRNTGNGVRALELQVGTEAASPNGTR